MFESLHHSVPPHLRRSLPEYVLAMITKVRQMNSADPASRSFELIQRALRSLVLNMSAITIFPSSAKPIKPLSTAASRVTSSDEIAQAQETLTRPTLETR